MLKEVTLTPEHGGQEVPMNSIESIIVWGIVAVAAFFSARALYRTFTGKKKNCGCRETTCPYAGRGCDQENPLC